jgi:hypothetical protein
LGRKKITSEEYKLLSAEDREKVKTRKREIKTDVDVLAFDEQNHDHIANIDWRRMLDRNIVNKVEVIFEAMKWDMSKIIIPE